MFKDGGSSTKSLWLPLLWMRVGHHHDNETVKLFVPPRQFLTKVSSPTEQTHGSVNKIAFPLTIYRRILRNHTSLCQSHHGLPSLYAAKESFVLCDCLVQTLALPNAESRTTSKIGTSHWFFRLDLRLLGPHFPTKSRNKLWTYSSPSGHIPVVSSYLGQYTSAL